MEFAVKLGVRGSRPILLLCTLSSLLNKPRSTERWIFFSAIATLCFSWCFSLENLGIVAINKAFHVTHATVADFNGVSVKDFTQDVPFGEMHVDQLQLIIVQG